MKKSTKSSMKKPVVKKAQMGKSVKSVNKFIAKSPSQQILEKTKSKNKNVRWEGGNTGVDAPAYMLDDIGNPLPMYESTVKEKLRKANKLKSGGKLKKK